MGGSAPISPVAEATHPDAGEWRRVLGLLRDEVGDTAFRSWLQSLRVERVADGEAVVAVPTRFLRTWIAEHYADRLLTLWRGENPAITRLSLIIDPRVTASVAGDDLPAAGAEENAGEAAASDFPPNSPRTGNSFPRRSTRASHSRISSSASRTNWRMPPRGGSPKPAPARSRPCRSIRFSSMAVSASARPI